MKAKLFLIPVTLLAFIGCGRQPGYTIGGEAPDTTFEGARVYLAERINRVWRNLDSTLVTNGKFELTGANVDSVRIIHLRLFDKNGELIASEPFVLENGAMQARISEEKITVSGTRQNDAFNLYKKEKNGFLKKIDLENERLLKMPDSLKTEQVEDSIQARIEAIKSDMTRQDADYAALAANTIIGNYIFTTSHYNFTIEQKEALFSKMDNHTKAIPRIAELIKTTAEEKKTAPGQPYIDFSMQNPAGKMVSLSHYVGKTNYVLVDFWASWCGPCIASFPQLTSFYQKYKGEQLEIVGVSLDREHKAWTDAIGKYQLTWPHLSDLQYWESEGVKLYAVSVIPSTVLIDKTGKIVGRNMPLRKIRRLLTPSEEQK